MSELITVCIVVSILVAAWLALCIETQGVKEGVKMAVGIPVMVISVLAAFAYVGHSFIVVFG